MKLRVVQAVQTLVLCVCTIQASGLNLAPVWRAVEEVVGPQTNHSSSLDFADFACRPKHSRRGTTKSPPVPCSAPNRLNWGLCTADHFFQIKLRRCLGTTSTGCSIILLLHVLRERWALKSRQPRWLCSEFKRSKQPFALALGRALVQRCEMRRPLQSSACTAGPRGKCVVFGGGCGLALSARINIMTLAYSRMPLRASAAERSARLIGCWEPELQAAAAIYRAAGRWEVDKSCVDSIYKIALRSLEHTIPLGIREFLAAPKDKVIEIFLLDKGSLFRSLLAHAPSIYGFTSNFFRQGFLYPMFARFLALAEKRRASSPSASRQPPVVSCKGLRGPPGQVIETTLGLLRLLAINELHVHTFSYPSMFAVTALNVVLPCSVSRAIQTPAR